jgi:alkylation response protein AidB-like acyl-CoA dehydrogenase
MDFNFSVEHNSLRETVRRHMEEEAAPFVRQSDESETFPKQLFRRWGELGMLAARYPESDGGVGMDKISDCIIREEIARVSQAYCAAFSAHSHLGMWPIWKVGTPTQREQYFNPAAAGEKIACFGLSEPDGGSDIRAMKTRAEKVRGGWKITGSKLYITNAPIADFITLAARTKPDLSADAISLFIIDLPAQGLIIESLKKEGLRGSETGLLHIDDLFVPDSHLLGEKEGTYPVILESLSENRVGVSASVLGLARGAYEEALQFAKARTVRGKPIIEYQAVAHRLADMATDIEATRWMVYWGAWKVDKENITDAEASKIKLVASEAALRITENAIRIMGGAGIMRDHKVGMHHRDALVYVIGEGTSDIQRNIIGRALRKGELTE